MEIDPQNNEIRLNSIDSLALRLGNAALMWPYESRERLLSEVQRRRNELIDSEIIDTNIQVGASRSQAMFERMRYGEVLDVMHRQLLDHLPDHNIAAQVEAWLQNGDET